MGSSVSINFHREFLHSCDIKSGSGLGMASDGKLGGGGERGGERWFSLISGELFFCTLHTLW